MNDTTPRVTPVPRWDVVASVAVGGATGSVLRYTCSLLVPGALGTFLVNALGCLCLGALMAVLAERGAHRLLRPFLGVGVLGGFTTFSTYVIDGLTLSTRGHALWAVVYLLGTVVVALLAVVSGMALARALLPSPVAEPAAETS